MSNENLWRNVPIDDSQAVTKDHKTSVEKRPVGYSSIKEIHRECQMVAAMARLCELFVGGDVVLGGHVQWRSLLWQTVEYKQWALVGEGQESTAYWACRTFWLLSAKLRNLAISGQLVWQRPPNLQDGDSGPSRLTQTWPVPNTLLQFQIARHPPTHRLLPVQL
jgi:hypothetical protein